MSRCARDHEADKRDLAWWSTLADLGHQHVEADSSGPAETYEVKNCCCGSTLYKQVA